MPNAYLQAALLQLDNSSPRFPEQLRDVLRRKEFDEQVSSLQTTADLMEVIDYLDRALDKLDPSSSVFRLVLRRLQKICTSRMRIPTSHVLPISELKINRDPIASGGFSDVFRGRFRGREVCVKRLRVSSTGGPEKMLYREAVTWKRLKHANVVPFIGVTFAPLQIVSEWMSGGDLTAHIKSNPHTNRISLLVDIAEGLNYLHECDVVHGDLKGPNIMVGADSRARITDFGLARDQGAAEEAGASAGGTARWTAPEILQGQEGPSKHADVFSFAMVMVETFTGAAPFDLHLSITVALAIMRGDRPPRPAHPVLTDNLWRLMQDCWSQEPLSRPSMAAVIEVLPGRRTSSHKRTSSTPTRPNLGHDGPVRSRAMTLATSSNSPGLKQHRGPPGVAGGRRPRVSSVMEMSSMPSRDSGGSDGGAHQPRTRHDSVRDSRSRNNSHRERQGRPEPQQPPLVPKERAEPSNPPVTGGGGHRQEREAKSAPAPQAEEQKDAGCCGGCVIA